ncbi:uncharacterized protein EI90DRAFT_3021659, partial [Cantharellus anzutake]|uniref:uncharacterized protein n=1 Tax=Cantharellus anzutake TaxID=1750568 RepID=UPI0019053684
MTMMPANGVARAVSPLGSRRAARFRVAKWLRAPSEDDGPERLKKILALKAVAQGLVCINQPFDYSKVVAQQHGLKGFFKPSPQPREGGIYMAPETANNAKYRMDGKVIILPPAIRGCKNDSCSGSALFEAVGYYPQFLKNVLGQDRQSRFPCVLMVDSGETSMSAVSSLDAFRKGIQWMETHYESLPSLAPAADRAFPYPKTRQAGISASCISHELGESFVSPEECLHIKFAKRYSEEACRLLANLGHAPQLWGVTSLPGSWLVVIVDFSRYRPLSDITILSNDKRKLVKSNEISCKRCTTIFETLPFLLTLTRWLSICYILIGQEHTRKSDTQDKLILFNDQLVYRFHFRCGVWFGRGVEVREKPVRTGTEPGTKLQFGSGSLTGTRTVMGHWTGARKKKREKERKHENENKPSARAIAMLGFDSRQQVDAPPASHVSTWVSTVLQAKAKAAPIAGKRFAPPLSPYMDPEL